MCVRKILIVLAGFVLLPLCSSVWAITDLNTLGSPNVTISPNSGPPGTKITITVSHIPDISKTSYPYPDLYIYLPFSQPFGTPIASHCGGQDCFPIYRHDDAMINDFADRTITFSLPSINNPKPVFLNGMENDVCDIVVNGKVAERFSTLCNTKDEPQGLYQIKLAWALESDLSQISVVKTIPFSVTSTEISSTSATVADNGNILLKEYQNGTINQTTFYAKLKSKGWTDEQIRQALAVIGKLPHQMGVPGSDANMSFSQVNSSVNSNLTSESNVKKTETVPSVIQSHNASVSTSQPKPENSSQTSIPSVSPTVQSVPTNTAIPKPQNDLLSNGIIIGLSISAAVIMASVMIFVKTQRRKTNTK